MNLPVLRTRNAGGDAAPDIELHRSSLNFDMEMAAALAKSDLVPREFRGKPSNVLVAIGLGRSLGLEPAQALYGMHVIEGKPSPTAKVQAALVRGAGHRLRILDSGPTSVTVEITRKDDPDYPVSVTYDTDKAAAAGFFGLWVERWVDNGRGGNRKQVWELPDGMSDAATAEERKAAGAPDWALNLPVKRKDNWWKDTETMLHHRAVTTCVGRACPEVVAGLEFEAQAEQRTDLDHEPDPVEVAQTPPPARSNRSRPRTSSTPRSSRSRPPLPRPSPSSPNCPPTPSPRTSSTTATSGPARPSAPSSSVAASSRPTPSRPPRSTTNTSPASTSSSPSPTSSPASSRSWHERARRARPPPRRDRRPRRRPPPRATLPIASCAPCSARPHRSTSSATSTTTPSPSAEVRGDRPTERGDRRDEGSRSAGATRRLASDATAPPASRRRSTPSSTPTARHHQSPSSSPSRPTPTNGSSRPRPPGRTLQLGDRIHDTITIDGEPIQVAAEVVAFGRPRRRPPQHPVPHRRDAQLPDSLHSTLEFATTRRSRSRPRGRWGSAHDPPRRHLTCDGCDQRIDGLPWRVLVPTDEHTTDQRTDVHHVCSPECGVDYARRHMEGRIMRWVTRPLEVADIDEWERSTTTPMRPHRFSARLVRHQGEARARGRPARRQRDRRADRRRRVATSASTAASERTPGRARIS